MGEHDSQEQGRPLDLSATLRSEFVGESPLLVASGYLQPSGYMYKTYLPAPEETIESVAEGLSRLAGNETMAVSVLEGVPLVALRGDTAESIQERWRILKLLSNADVAVEELEPLPEKSPETLHQEIGVEVLRVFKDSLEQGIRYGQQRDAGSSDIVIDWMTHRSVQSFAIVGNKVPEWLRRQYLCISTDGTLVKMENRAKDSFEGDKEGPIRVGPRHSGGNNLRPIDEPIVFNDSETVDEYFLRLNTHGYEYRDLDDQRLGELLRVMKHLRQVHP